MLFTAISLPRIVATAWDSTVLQWRGVGERFDAGEWAGVVVGLIGTVAVLLPVAGSVFMIVRLGRKAGRATWARAEKMRGGRPLAALAGVALVAGLAFLWWPNGEYRPLQKGERGTVADGLRTIAEVPTGRPGLTEDRAEELEGAPARADQESTATTVPLQSSTTTPTNDESPTTTARATTRTTDEVRTPTTTSDGSGSGGSDTTVP
jgi:putative peptide zinc metalloprotease protein